MDRRRACLPCLVSGQSYSLWDLWALQRGVLALGLSLNSKRDKFLLSSFIPLPQDTRLLPGLLFWGFNPLFPLAWLRTFVTSCNCKKCSYVTSFTPQHLLSPRYDPDSLAAFFCFKFSGRGFRVGAAGTEAQALPFPSPIHSEPNVHETEVLLARVQVSSLLMEPQPHLSDLCLIVSWFILFSAV